MNKAGDWTKGTNEKTRIAGLSKDQIMTPQASAEAALKWPHYKGRINPDDRNRLGPYQGHYEALRGYNAATSSGGLKPGSEYANDVFNRAWASYGDWQQ